MKRFLVSFLSLSLILVSCSLPQPKISPTSTPSTNIFNTPWDDRSLFKTGLVASEQSVLNELTGASVYHLQFNIAKDFYHITGTEEVRYTNNETVSLDEVQLRLFPNILGGEMTLHMRHLVQGRARIVEGRLRALVRQDPDILMVGEIRDKETINLAINAALTGHLVLSTIHTNSAAGAIPRMIDMGADMFVEVGPGRVLCGLLRQIDKKLAATNVEDEKSLIASLAKLKT